MKHLFFGLCVGAVGCAFALQCPATARSKETVLHAFGGDPDGAYTYAGLIDISGTLYGTSYEGGVGEQCGKNVGCGTVFSINPATGAETVVYSFLRGADGAFPEAGLIDVKGMLYGTTDEGGSHDVGTVFSVSLRTGAEAVVYSFCSQGGDNCSDGEHPESSLIDVKGTLYGTAHEGGAHGYGTVFSINPTTGAETVVYSFAGGTDGQNPYAGLIDVKGMLYGTTYYGGANGGGTVFSVNPATGAETVLHTFGGAMDGSEPEAGLINVKGMLYGTTVEDGAIGEGTVFSVNPATGAETVLHSFGNGADGQYPYAGLISVKDTLYGTTGNGGASGGGTEFAVDPGTGAETVLYSFCSQQNCPDGEEPYAGLIDVKGKLYGTTYHGGANSRGTVFAFKRP